MNSNLQLALTVVLLSMLAPRCEAIISSYQGQMMLMGRRVGSNSKSYNVEMRLCCYVCLCPISTNRVDFHHTSNANR